MQNPIVAASSPNLEVSNNALNPPLLPPNEAQRLEALRRYNILDTPPEESFDRITTLAARLFEVPIALVSLVDEYRAWFKSSYGFDTPEVSRESTMCSFALLYNDILIVPDTRSDPRFACMPFATSEPGLRFYAGAPLVTQDGFNLGTLCLLDSKPRLKLTSSEEATLKDLAAMVVDELELRLAAHKIAQMDVALIEVTQGVSAAIGQEFFSSLVQHLTKALDVNFAFIGELIDPDTIKTIAVSAQRKIVENIEYTVINTPCHTVIEQRKTCFYPSNIQATFPLDDFLVEMEVESYIGTPLLDSTGAVLGILGVLDTKPFENVQLAESLLTIFATRASTELERSRAEEERNELLVREQAAREQAESANRMKDEFLAVVSHELRSPLNPILGWSRMLLSRKLNPVTTTKALEAIERNAKLQAELIEDLLDVSRMMRGKLSLQVCAVNLRQPIEAAIETVQLAAEAKNIKVEKFIDSSTNLISGDANRLQQILWNLLSNAIKFTPEGGQVKISLEYSENATQENINNGSYPGSQKKALIVNSYAQITVSDTGKGISAEFLPYVFERFRQADGATTRSQSGLGLGLAIVRHLVELHGGTVEVDSAGEGFGATFIVKLPLMQVQPQANNSELILEANGNKVIMDIPTLNGLQVLIVDDEEDTRFLLTIALENYGAKVTAVSSATEALVAVQELMPDVLVSDIGMPNEDGYTLIRKIRALEPEKGGKIPAAALTAYARSEDSQKAIALGFQKHIAKPVEPAELVAVIASLAKAN
ncbi:GAF sensor hybrid histidine kinase [Crinalium epipsammum PCC 9333]|uniref:Circadian input-output histidine kinase CikA n=1 Tax=Crinalium epipsammum PCC 9333 TaxID=1173022 RepID=K9W161_9CYAN|nr:ATP-binding protein [Crinalium epipsammum]AFZ14093.1 GAF sensor hybrid histidine kinase [Crinalium epipsammum PCC 9333]